MDSSGGDWGQREVETDRRTSSSAHRTDEKHEEDKKSLAEYETKRKRQLAQSSRFWLNISTCFLCCFETTMA